MSIDYDETETETDLRLLHNIEDDRYYAALYRRLQQHLPTRLDRIITALLMLAGCAVLVWLVVWLVCID